MKHISNIKPSPELAVYESRENYFKKKIFLSEFFLFLLIIQGNHFNQICFVKTSYFVQPFKKKTFVSLRAPYRYKLARLSFIYSRYYITSCIKLKFTQPLSIELFKELSNLNNLSKIFNGNLYNQHSSKILVKTSITDNFTLKYFNIIFAKNFL